MLSQFQRSVARKSSTPDGLQPSNSIELNNSASNFELNNSASHLQSCPSGVSTVPAGRTPNPTPPTVRATPDNCFQSNESKNDKETIVKIPGKPEGKEQPVNTEPMNGDNDSQESCCNKLACLLLSLRVTNVTLAAFVVLGFSALSSEDSDKLPLKILYATSSSVPTNFPLAVNFGERFGQFIVNFPKSDMAYKVYALPSILSAFTAALAGLDLAVEANEVFSGGLSWLKMPVVVSAFYYNLTVMFISMLDLQHKLHVELYRKNTDRRYAGLVDLEKHLAIYGDRVNWDGLNLSNDDPKALKLQKTIEYFWSQIADKQEFPVLGRTTSDAIKHYMYRLSQVGFGGVSAIMSFLPMLGFTDAGLMIVDAQLQRWGKDFLKLDQHFELRAALAYIGAASRVALYINSVIQYLASLALFVSQLFGYLKSDGSSVFRAGILTMMATVMYIGFATLSGTGQQEATIRMMQNDTAFGDVINDTLLSHADFNGFYEGFVAPWLSLFMMVASGTIVNGRSNFMFLVDILLIMQYAELPLRKALPSKLFGAYEKETSKGDKKRKADSKPHVMVQHEVEKAIYSDNLASFKATDHNCCALESFTADEANRLREVLSGLQSQSDEIIALNEKLALRENKKDNFQQIEFTSSEVSLLKNIIDNNQQLQPLSGKLLNSLENLRRPFTDREAADNPAAKDTKSIFASFINFFVGDQGQGRECSALLNETSAPSYTDMTALNL